MATHRRIYDLALVAALRLHGITPVSSRREPSTNYPGQSKTAFYFEDTEECANICDGFMSGALEGSLGNFNSILRTLTNQIRDARQAVPNGR